MATRQARLGKAIFAGLVWLLLRVPTDIVLINCNKTGVMPYAITLQLLDFIVITFLFFQLLQYRMKRPWKCPACDGWGKRLYVPGQTPEKAAQLTQCTACQGSGYIWEIMAYGGHA